jgi:hypothetical protein
MHDWRSLVRASLLGPPKLAPGRRRAKAGPSLTFDLAQNAEILDELAHHLADTYDALVESGLTDREAFDHAMAELDATAAASADLRRAADRRALRTARTHSNPLEPSRTSSNLFEP